MTDAIVNVFPVPVAPSRTWWLRPFWTPSIRRSMARGWSPVGWKGASRRKSGTFQVYHRRARFVRAFDLHLGASLASPPGPVAAADGTPRPYGLRTPLRRLAQHPPRW